MAGRSPYISMILTLGVWCGLFGLLLIGHGRGVEVSPRLGFTLAFVGVSAAVVTAVLATAATEASPRAIFVGLGVGLTALIWGGRWAPTSAASALAVGAGMLLVSARIGVAIGGRVTLARYVWPLVIVAVGADLWSVTAPSGLTRQAIVDAPPSDGISVFLLTVPVPGGGLDGILGLGDIIFSGFLLGLAHRCGLSLRRAVFGLALGLAACLLFLLLLALPAPALVFIGPAFALALGSAVKPQPNEVAQGLVFVGLIWAIGALL